MPLELSIDDLYEFKACPLRYKFRKIDKVPDLQITENDGLREAVLSTISYYYVNLREGRRIGIEDMKNKFSSLWYGDKIYNILQDDDQKQRKRELEAFGMLNSFYRQQQYAPDKVLAVNLDFRIPFGDDLYIRGQLPVVRETIRGLELVNFKTGSHKADEFWQRTDMGLTLQAVAFQSIFKKEVDSICLQYLKLGTTLFVNRKKKDFQRLYKSIRMVKKSLDEGWFYPRESYHCDKCPAKSFCIEWN